MGTCKVWESKELDERFRVYIYPLLGNNKTFFKTDVS